MAARIEDYALVGDGETAALIARDGSVDFLCWPRFDSDPCFTALLGDERHGHWRIAPAGPVTGTTRRYRGDTLILETTFETDAGTVRLTDFMPQRQGASMLIRIVEGVRGEVPMHLALRLRFEYGSMPPWSQPHGNGLLAEVGPDLVVLHAPLKVRPGRAEASASFAVKAGERIPFVLAYGDSSLPAPEQPDVEQALSQTQAFWENWIGRFDKPCDWPAQVRRSLITLKALIHQRTGGLVAAATTSLPEMPGGSMNWDYRFCWLRDATFTLTALLNAGYHEEATAWRDWILRAVAGSPEQMRIVYRVDGARRLDEWEADWLPGYEGARPVRVGNAASVQTQLDVYGELLEAMHVASAAGIPRERRGIEVETALVHYLESIWDKPGSDIWETRGDPQRYTYSQVMAWVGIDRYLKGARTHKAAGPERVKRLTALRQQIHDDVCAQGFHTGRGHFVRAFGSEEIDASLLLLPIVHFLPADDPRITGTVAAVERELMDGGLVRRLKARGGEPQEGAFLACSCWLADCMKLQGRDADARTMLERVLALSNDVGLLSEEYHVPSRRMMGNIPQALTHLGVVNTALFLSGPVQERK